MSSIFEVVGPNNALQIFGVKLVGVNAENGIKLLFTVSFAFLLLLISYALRAAARKLLNRKMHEKAFFWTRQGIKLASALVLILGVASIWFDDPTRLATALGLVTAGLAFALQKVVTAIAGYFVILRGNTFNVGDRITMGGVRGDVIALDFTQTTLMEMGQPPAVQTADPAMWVKSREYTGRIVTVSNAKVFDDPVYNYTREFPYIWEEMSVPISYSGDRGKAEEILLSAAERFTVDISKLGSEALQEMQRRYFVSSSEMHPRVYHRLTDNWLELTVRFIVRDRGIREVKDQMSRQILRAFEEHQISIASTTFEIVGVPTLDIKLNRTAQSSQSMKQVPE